MKRLLAGLLLMSGFCAAQVPKEESTSGYLNCRYIRSLTSSQSLYFIVGFAEAFKEFASDQEQKRSSGARTDEINQAVRTFCNRPENANLVVAWAFYAFWDRLNGKSEAEIEKGLEDARKASVLK